MTAVKGHLRELHFEGGINKNWSDYPLEDLFRTPLTKIVPTHFKPLADNITQEIKYSDTLFIWTDCDREGEAIGADIADLCLRTKPNLTVWRARFSAMQPNEIHYAAQHPTQLDMKQVEAVRARSELDLRIGAAFTRLQTINLRPYFSSSAKNKVLSYGSCQFPTLGFVVDRYLQVQNFIPEEFWKIVMTYAQPNQGEQQQQQQQKGQASLKTTFNWRRDHLFDRWACFTLYEKCFEKKIATVTKVKSKQTSKWKPLPLTTVEMQKIGCRVLNMSGSHLMTIAEGLYTSGLISYPRTETDQYDSSFDFMKYINMQTQDSQWGQYARLLRDGEFEKPRNGKNNDKAHPPIHPTGYDARLSGDPKRVYEFITRRFLASCWKNAIGFETAVEVKIDTEYFDTKGLVILEKNFLEVYTYDKWKGNEIPEFHEGDEFIPDQLEMQRGQTTPPRLLTEPDLISMMEKNEIGTDATIAEHIQKILDREYVYKENQYFKPLTLGIALILGYDQIGLEASLSKPFLRRQVNK
ncbi:DNA topoisomerase [Cokeromyces recurvatus]|uniref:DNA topoisomerase n=1 Tax=Cokeromyces recurvatus TaxID=90255 RepID=UPI00221FFECE|nr:DNA topoisomerase [Cokeromyces recurvatus]KAI7906236.1 DNA topoisomerase [Cokeromyces recurvatus]